MKKKYAFHPNNYAIGETEKYYSDMAAKGWILEERGLFWSKFKKSESKNIRYRVEIMLPDQYELKEGTDEQILLYEESGWKYVSGSGRIHVFCSPVGSEAPELYLKPEQQAPVIKSQIYSYIWQFALWFILFILNMEIFDLVRKPSRFLSYFSTLDSSVMYALLFSIYLWMIVNSITGVISLNKLYRNLKSGIPLDHLPKSKRFPTQIMPYVMLIIVLILNVFYNHM